MAEKYREIDHTADAGLRIYGTNLKELFIHAAEGMFSIIGSGDFPSGEPRVTENIRIDSADRELLLKDWLSELLYLHSANHCLFNHFTIESMTDTSLKATIAGFTIQFSDEDGIQDVKAVTYHGLKVTQDANGFEAQVIFDI
ncbi:MAG: archease [Candidatus Marinimicrobia bacterium]|nr:archease [Candidatus Neomarinimicrobiota bacterium]MCF7828634.1 archease [Candidatus Neomarinimicrobiota bacterium]MCF7880375.1 archease [Candidatus Neomarinimicrobiota bacterium]